MEAATSSRGRPVETFLVFLKLGLTSFGGPVAHLGYFRTEFVERRRWLTEAAFADIVALCQYLPGPASSQTGFAIGLTRSGLLGGLMAWLGFTAPSAALMLAAGYGLPFAQGPFASGAIHGLKLAAVAVVAQAVWGMARTLAIGPVRTAIALLALALATLGGGMGQWVAMGAGALAGVILIRTGSVASGAPLGVVSRGVGAACLALFVLFLAGLPLLGAATGLPVIRSADAFYRSGALVFGGGHVVLPLLQSRFVATGAVGEGPFLTGYALAQALPGPVFTFAAYLGAIEKGGPGGMLGGLIGLVFIFLPGLLVLTGLLPFWSALRSHPKAAGAVAGANAAVVGVLAAALYSPIWTSAVHAPTDFLWAAAGFIALTSLQIPAFWVVSASAVAGLVLPR